MHPSIQRRLLRRFCMLLGSGAHCLARWGYALERWPVESQAQRRILRRNVWLKGAYEGRRVFVVGNGPSLGRVDLTLLAGEVVFAVNGFARHPILDIWQPTILSLLDPLYYSHPEAVSREMDFMLGRMPKTRFFVPLAGHGVFEATLGFPSDRTFYAHLLSDISFHEQFALDLTRGIPGAYNVILFSLMLALYSGASEIITIGLDHDYLASPREERRFAANYQEGIAKERVQHITELSYLQLITMMRMMFQGYEILRGLARSRGQHIRNATPGGYLDVFTRVDYNALFAVGASDFGKTEDR